MSTYTLKTVDGDTPLLRMTAASPDDSPTNVEILDDGMSWATEYVGTLVDEYGASVATIGNRFSAYSAYLDEDGADEDVAPAGTEAVEKELASGSICKTDEERQMIFGWAYVSHDREGQVVVDKSGDFIDSIEELEKSAYGFVVNSRSGDLDHTNLKSAEMVESMVFTPDKIEKMGIPKGAIPEGAWWIGFHFPDKGDWEQAKTRGAFSIHGSGTRKSV